MAQTQAAVLMQEVLDATAEMRHPGLQALAEHDAAHGGDLGPIGAQVHCPQWMDRAIMIRDPPPRSGASTAC